MSKCTDCGITFYYKSTAQRCDECGNVYLKTAKQFYDSCGVVNVYKIRDCLVTKLVPHPTLLSGSIKITQVDDYVFLGNKAFAENSTLLKSYNIQHVITVMNHKIDNTTKFIELDDNDYEDIQIAVQNCIAWMQEARKRKQRVVVHCRMAFSRSVAMVLAYLMIVYHLTLHQAFKYILRFHLHTEIAPGFICQMLELERTLQYKDRICIKRYLRNVILHASREEATRIINVVYSFVFFQTS